MAATSAEPRPSPPDTRPPSPGIPDSASIERVPNLLELIGLLVMELRQTNLLVQELLEQNHSLLTAMAEMEGDPDAAPTVGLDGLPIPRR